jgi:cob(I)alamin adenosyltransferase
MEKGYVQVYTGNGKGKTTCMLGLALRAVGAGLRVYIGQFMKDGDYSEIKALRQYLPIVAVEQYGEGLGFVKKGEASTEQLKAAYDGLERAKTALNGGYDVVILDEINVAVYLGLLNVRDILGLIDAKPDGAELVLTGRYADPLVIEKADLVTEMTEIKHYYNQGVPARTGIEK